MASSAESTIAARYDFAASVSRRPRASWSCEATDASNSRAVNGLTRYSFAPACRPSRRASSPARAESRITGIDRVRSSARIAASRPNPSTRRHHHVREHEIRSAVADAIQRDAAIADELDAIRRSEDAGQILAHVRVVVDDEHARGRRLRRPPERSRPPGAGVCASDAGVAGSQRSASSTYGAPPMLVDANCRAASTFSRGRCEVPVRIVTVKVVPRPSWLSTVTSPP